MRKFYTAALLVLFPLAALHSFAFFDSPHRLLEVGFSSDLGFSDNYFSVSDILKKDVVIDLRDIADSLSGRGLVFNGNAEPSLFVNLNLKKFRFGLSFGTEVTGEFLLADSLFDFLGYGNDFGEEIRASMEMNLDVFAFVSARANFRLGGFDIEIAPAAVRPVLHAEASDVSFSFVNDEDGSVRAAMNADIAVYSCADIEPLWNDGEFDAGGLLSGMKSGWGFDLSLAASRPVFRNLTLGAFTRIPIVPGRLKNKAAVGFEGEVALSSISDLISDSGEVDSDFTKKDGEFSSADYKISRPFKIGLSAAWRPFGDWFVFDGMLGVGVRYPYSGQAEAYVEYRAGLDAEIFHIAGFSLSTGYVDQVFVHRLGLMLNARVLEIDASVSLRGGNFLRSWKGTGVGAGITVIVGF